MNWKKGFKYLIGMWVGLGVVFGIDYLVKSNSLCIFQIYYPAAKYMELSTEVYYVGQENCNGLIDTYVTHWQHELRKL